MAFSSEEKLQQLTALAPAVSRETADDLLHFEALIQKWQPHINLVANATLPDLWNRHILDSVQLFPLQSDKQKWLDLGSGGGFPGLIIAICLKNTGGSIDLIESNGKKAGFLRTAIAALELPAVVHCERIETMVGRISIPDIVTARALTALNPLFGLIKPLIGEATIGLLQKGRDYRKEIEEARQHWTFNLIEHRSAIDAQSVILEFSDLHKGLVK